MRVIFDSNILIGARLKRDKYHKAASKILEAFGSRKINSVFMTNYVLAEAVNFVLRKGSFKLAEEIYNYLTHTDGVHIIYVDKVMESRIKYLFHKYKTLSLTDCSLIALAEELNINTLFSFDSGFDKVKNIIRKQRF